MKPISRRSKPIHPRPLYGRAFQSAYPPASSFKPIVALAALNNGVVTEESTIYCPAAITIGTHGIQQLEQESRRAPST